MNPKTHITNVHVINEDIIEVFGESWVLITTNLDLDPTLGRNYFVCIHNVMALPTLPTTSFMFGLSKVTLLGRKV